MSHSALRFRSIRPIAFLFIAVATLSCVQAAAGGEGSAVSELLHGSREGAAAHPDPRGNSWLAIRASLDQFAHPLFLLRLLLGLLLAAGCAWIVAWHPRRATRLDPLSDLEERKALILLGVVGAVIAELTGVNQTLAFVIFGIGALLRFRTVLENPKLTGKAVCVVVVGLACGLGQWAMAVFVTAFCWVLIYWLDSHMSCRVRIRFDKHANLEEAEREARDTALRHRCRVESSSVITDERQVMLLLHVPAGLEPNDLTAALKSSLSSGQQADINVRVS